MKLTKSKLKEIINEVLEEETINEAPSVFSPNSRRAQVDAMKQNGVEEYDIPAFLRKQAD